MEDNLAETQITRISKSERQCSRKRKRRLIEKQLSFKQKEFLEFKKGKKLFYSNGVDVEEKVGATSKIQLEIAHY